MKFEEIGEVIELLNERKYQHRPGYSHNEKGSYIRAGKTYWDYSGGATPGNERLVTQIQVKAQMDDKYLSRSEIKRYLKSEDSQKLFNKLKRSAIKKFGEAKEDDSHYKAYLYGGFAKAAYRAIAAGKKTGMTYLL